MFVYLPEKKAEGGARKLEAFLDMLGDYDILELARTGLTGLTRGSDDVVIL